MTKWKIILGAIFVISFAAIRVSAINVDSYSFLGYETYKKEYGEVLTTKDIKRLNMKKSVRLFQEDVNASTTEPLVSGEIELLSFYYLPTFNDDFIPKKASSLQTASSTSEILDTPLFYPNPFRYQNSARLTYTLSKDMDIEIRLYNMRGHEIFREIFLAGELGAEAGYNIVTFSADTLDNFDLSAGIYFFILINENKVLGKGKFGVMP